MRIPEGLSLVTCGATCSATGFSLTTALALLAPTFATFRIVIRCRLLGASTKLFLEQSRLLLNVRLLLETIRDPGGHVGNVRSSLHGDRTLAYHIEARKVRHSRVSGNSYFQHNETPDQILEGHRVADIQQIPSQPKPDRLTNAPVLMNNCRPSCYPRCLDPSQMISSNVTRSSQHRL